MEKIFLHKELPEFVQDGNISVFHISKKRHNNEREMVSFAFYLSKFPFKLCLTCITCTTAALVDLIIWMLKENK